jgi:hypothetical protein
MELIPPVAVKLNEERWPVEGSLVDGGKVCFSSHEQLTTNDEPLTLSF